MTNITNTGIQIQTLSKNYYSDNLRLSNTNLTKTGEILGCSKMVRKSVPIQFVMKEEISKGL